MNWERVPIRWDDQKSFHKRVTFDGALKEKLDLVLWRYIAGSLSPKDRVCAITGQEDMPDVEMNNGYRGLMLVMVKFAASILTNVIISN